MKIVNLTQHAASSEQREQGVSEPADKERVKTLLTFEDLPTREEMIERAAELADIAVAERADSVMIGGAPFFMAPLEVALLWKGVKPLYAFSCRETMEEQLPDGGVRKTAVFRHLGFVEAATRRWTDRYFNSREGVDAPLRVVSVPPRWQRDIREW